MTQLDTPKDPRATENLGGLPVNAEQLGSGPIGSGPIEVPVFRIEAPKKPG